MVIKINTITAVGSSFFFLVFSIQISAQTFIDSTRLIINKSLEEILNFESSSELHLLKDPIFTICNSEVISGLKGFEKEEYLLKKYFYTRDTTNPYLIAVNDYAYGEKIIDYNPEDAIGHFVNAERVAFLTSQDYGSQGMYTGSLNSSHAKGYCLMLLKEYEDAQTTIEKYIEKRSLIKNDYLNYDLYYAYTNLSAIHYFLDNCDEGLKYANRAFQLYKNDEEKHDVAFLNNNLNNFGALYWCKGEEKIANNYFEQAKLLLDSLSDLYPLNMSHLEDCINVRSHQIEMLMTGDFNRNIFDKLNLEIEALLKTNLKKFKTIKQQRDWLNLSYSHYQKVLAITLKNHKLGLVTDILKNSENFIFQLNLLKSSEQGIDSALTELQKSSIQLEHDYHFEYLSERKKTVVLSKLFASKVLLALHSDENDLKQSYKKLDITFMDAVQIVQIDSIIYIVEWSKGTVKRIIQKPISEFWEGAKHFSQLNMNDLNSLYQTLIAPLNIPKGSTITIIPDGELAHIPFGALLTDSTDATSFLEKDYTINYQLSATLMQQLEQKKVNTTGLAAFAPPFMTNPDELYAYARGVTHEDSIQLYHLPYSGEEVKSINTTWDAPAYTVTKDNVIDALQNNRIFHFSGHAVTYNEDSDYSFLALSSDVDNLDDKLLLKELYNLECNNEMVVLSACETGTGEIAKGEGVLSLARGFFYAGAKSVISTLWSVNDQSSSMIMKEFYKQLRKGKRKDEALRQAKLHYLSSVGPEYQDPYYWAGFVAVGDMAPIFTPWWKSYWTYGSVGLILILSGLYFRGRHKMVIQ